MCFRIVPLESIIDKLARAPPRRSSITPHIVENSIYKEDMNRSKQDYILILEEMKILGGIAMGYARLCERAISLREQAKKLYRER